MSAISKPTAPNMPSIALLSFVAITFAITWGVVGSFIFFPEAASSVFGPIGFGNPFYFLATWAPAISAFLLVLAYSGIGGLRLFLSRVLLWRCGLVWWLFILLGVPIVFAAGSLLKGGGLIAPLPPEGVGSVLALMFIMFLLGPIEEFGWRGVAQPLLQRHIAPFWAGALIGVVWGVWHLPAFYLSGVVFAEWSFLPFLIGNVTLSILITPIFNASRGSILLPMLFHWQLINPFWPDAQPWDTWILVGVAAAVVWWRHDEMFSRHAAVTEVIPE